MQPLTVTVGPSPEMCESTWHDNSENAAIPARTVFGCLCSYTLSDVIVVLTLTVYSEKQTSANSTFQMRGNDRMCNLSTTTTSKVNAAKKKEGF